MDNCFICGNPVDNGIQYLVSERKIRNGEKPWFAKETGHYTVCERCNERLQDMIGRIKEGGDK